MRTAEDRQLSQAQPQILEVPGRQLRYTVARIKSAGYEILDVQRDGDSYIVVVAMPPDTQLPQRTATSRKRRQPIGRTLRGVGTGLIVIAFGVALFGPAAWVFGTGVGVGLTTAAGGVLASSILLLPAALITLLILALLPAAVRFITKAQQEYGHSRRSQ